MQQGLLYSGFCKLIHVPKIAKCLHMTKHVIESISVAKEKTLA